MTVAVPNMPSGGGSHAWVWADSSYMRALAERCTRAARRCPHLPTSHELEAIGHELMEKARELDELNRRSGTGDSPAKAPSKPRKPKT